MDIFKNFDILKVFKKIIFPCCQTIFKKFKICYFLLSFFFSPPITESIHTHSFFSLQPNVSLVNKQETQGRGKSGRDRGRDQKEILKSQIPHYSTVYSSLLLYQTRHVTITLCGSHRLSLPMLQRNGRLLQELKLNAL